jgi:hypothetical protein
MAKKILICGNGPSLVTDLKNKDLSYFDYILRMNNWQPINGHNNRCDIWCTTFWYDIPDSTILQHRDLLVWDMFLYGKGYNFSEQRQSHCMNLLKKIPEFYLAKKTFDYFRNYIIRIPSPSCGMYAIFSAIIQQMDIFICGFDHFDANNHHYFDSNNFQGPHKGHKEKNFIHILIKENMVNLL